MNNKMTNNKNSSDISSIPNPSFNRFDKSDIQKMIFMYNAIQDGWTVMKINDTKYEFKKLKENVSEEVYLDQYIRKFIKFNISIDNLFRKNQNQNQNSQNLEDMEIENQ